MGGEDTVLRTLGLKNPVRLALRSICPDRVPLATYESSLSSALGHLVVFSVCSPSSPCGRQALRETEERLNKLPVKACDGADDLGTVLELIMETLHAANLTAAGRELVALHGFCVSTGDVTMGTSSPRFVKLCSEGDDDEETAEDTDTAYPVRSLAVERGTLARRLASFAPSLKATVQALEQGIVGATVCRSVRDGYTPKHVWQQIEDGVLANLRSLGFNPSFGANLLGGRRGWSNWTDIQASALTESIASLDAMSMSKRAVPVVDEQTSDDDVDVKEDDKEEDKEGASQGKKEEYTEDR